MNPTANVSSSSAKSPSESEEGTDRTVDLLDRGLLPPLPTAYLRGEDLDLLEPLRFLPPGEMPQGDPPTASRGELALALEIANRSYGHPRATELAEKLAAPETRVVVAGQQPGLFGGPLYTLSKMVAVARWASELEDAAGVPAVPVFWVATEDHDFAEVAKATIFTSNGVETFDLGDDPEPLTPVGMRSLGPELERVYEEMAEATHGDRYDDWLEVLGRWYRPDARFGEAFCRLMIHFLGEHTPLLLDSMLPEVKAAQAETLRRLVEDRDALEAAYAARDEEVEARGYEHQVSPQRNVSPLFVLHGGQRRRVEWSESDPQRYGLRGLEDGGGDVDELLERIDDNPSTVTPGVLARPAVQDAILGTYLQVLGPGEVSYMAQAAPTYKALGLPGPWITLRPQALILESHLEDKLEQTGVRLADLLDREENLEKVLADRSGGDPVAPAKERVLAVLEDLKGPVLELDPNLERPWEKTRDQIVRGLDALSGKATSARARQDEIRANRVDRLRQACLPRGVLQERLISSSHYPGKYREGFAESFFRQLGLDPRILQVIRP